MTGADPAGESELVRQLEEIEARGFVVLPELVGPDQLAMIRDELAPHLAGEKFGRNDFEGRRTERVYALLSKAPSIANLLVHPGVLALLDRLLLPDYLLSANLAINAHPGQSAQQFHHDDGYCRLARPRRHLGCSVIWAIDAFTPTNGATEVIPGSHRWGAEVPSEREPTTTAVTMPAGSAVVFLGTLWHRGGANRSSRPRLAITPQYCEPWVRQIENMALATPPEVARNYPVRVQELLGYSIHPPFIGYVDGLHPRRLLDVSADAT
jgi:ectoine hydroxylase-related dioxygenase (phytanoyl-CoA dioxygenase family)